MHICIEFQWKPIFKQRFCFVWILTVLHRENFNANQSELNLNRLELKLD